MTSQSTDGDEYTRCDLCDQIELRSKAKTPLPARPGGESKQVTAFLCESCQVGLEYVFREKSSTETQRRGGEA